LQRQITSQPEQTQQDDGNNDDEPLEVTLLFFFLHLMRKHLPDCDPIGVASTAAIVARSTTPALLCGIASTSSPANKGLMISASKNQPKPLRPRVLAATPTMIAKPNQKNAMISIFSPPS
jgi:hypothetical protein